VVHRHPAGIDVGNSAHYVAVRPDRDAEPVRRFECFTADLHRLANWLQSCGVKTVALSLTLTASNSVQLGNYNLTLSGNSGTITHSTTVPVEVNLSAGDFYGSVSHNDQNVKPGQVTTYQVTLFPAGGFTGT
jgi:hypothetical protein